MREKERLLPFWLSWSLACFYAVVIIILVLMEGENIAETVPEFCVRLGLAATRRLEEFGVGIDGAPLVLPGGLGHLLVLLCDGVLLRFALPEERDDDERRREDDEGRDDADVERCGRERDAADADHTLLLVRILVRLQRDVFRCFDENKWFLVVVHVV